MKPARNGTTPKLPPGLSPFDRAMRGLVKVTKAELDAEEAKYQRKKAAKKKRKLS